MRAKFIRGQDPKDAMELGDVRGRNLDNITNILIDHFAKVFPKGQEIGESRTEVNLGMGNRQDLQTDQIIIWTEYAGYTFNLIWTGNPIDTRVFQTFETIWQKIPRGAEGSNRHLTLNAALNQLSKWVKQI